MESGTFAPAPGSRPGTAALLRPATWLSLLLGAALIVLAARGDLWLDELWSLSFARKAQAAQDIFLRIHHDNNHPLNTLFLYVTGDGASPLWYRLLSVASGLASLYLAGFIARREWGEAEALGSVLLVGTCYPLLLYFSEARGYAPVMFFALASYAVLRENLREFRAWRVLLFWACSLLGVLSHGTFVMVTIALLAGSLVHELSSDLPLQGRATRFLAHHLPVLIFFAWWYLFFLKGMTIGRGPVYGTWNVLGQAAAYLLGVPDTPVFRPVALAGYLGLTLWGIGSLPKGDAPQKAFFATVLVLAPALMLLITRPTYLYFRYFIVCFPFFLLLASRKICSLGQSSAGWRWLVFGVLALLAAGQLQRDYLLVKLGRGDYTAAFRYISEHSAPGEVRIGTDHDFRNRMLFEFYAPRAPRGSDLRYVEQSRWLGLTPDWILTSSADLDHQVKQELQVNGVGTYRLTESYPFSGVSGWNWYLFRRETPGGS
jgi:hypothetical protein